jgi:multiple sugar transport system permease protein
MNKQGGKILKFKKVSPMLTLNRIFCYIFLVLLSAACLFMFVILIINATRSNYEIQKGFSFVFGNQFMSNLQALLDNKNLSIVTGLQNSLLIAAATAIVTTYFSALTAYAIHIYNFKLKKFAYAFILLVMMIPPQVSSMGFVNLMWDMNLVDTFVPLIIPSIASPIVFFFMKQYMESVLPYEIIEAARVDGSGEIRTFHTIVLPIIKPAIAVQAIFAFVSSWNNYYIPALIIQSNDRRTLPLLIAQLKSSNPETFDLGVVYMLITFAIVPLLIVYLILSKFIIKGITLGSVKG